MRHRPQLGERRGRVAAAAELLAASTSSAKSRVVGTPSIDRLLERALARVRSPRGRSTSQTTIFASSES